MIQIEGENGNMRFRGQVSSKKKKRIKKQKIKERIGAFFSDFPVGAALASAQSDNAPLRDSKHCRLNRAS